MPGPLSLRTQGTVPPGLYRSEDLDVLMGPCVKAHCEGQRMSRAVAGGSLGTGHPDEDKAIWGTQEGSEGEDRVASTV